MAKTIKKNTTKSTPIVKKIPNIVAKPVESKTVRYLDKNVKISPRKLRLIANIVKKMTPASALNHLTIKNNKAARVLTKAIKTAIADATNNHKLVENSLKFSSILVNQSIRFKRMDKSHSSRFASGLIQKRHSRLTIYILGIKN